MDSSSTHLVLIPSFNTGARVYATVLEARHHWNPVWVVIDGSTDGTAEGLRKMAVDDAGLRVWVRPVNEGKGAAVLFGLGEAEEAGFTHVLTMDADGQHPAGKIPEFMRVSQQNRDAMILGSPEFDASAPLIRVRGRKISNWWANLETLHGGIGDSLCGFRVYPAGPLAAIMRRQRWMRRFDFDPEAVVRMSWRGVQAINIGVPVRYFSANEGGVSHFNYLRDNALLSFMHVRLMTGFVLRLPQLVWRKIRKAGDSPKP